MHMKVCMIFKISINKVKRFNPSISKSLFSIVKSQILCYMSPVTFTTSIMLAPSVSPSMSLGFLAKGAAAGSRLFLSVVTRPCIQKNGTVIRQSLIFLRNKLESYIQIWNSSIKKIISRTLLLILLLCRQH